MAALVSVTAVSVLAQLSPMTVVTAGNDHDCGLTRDHTIRCWGMSTVGQTRAPTGRWAQIDAGTVLTCGIQEEARSITCWGGGRAVSAGIPAGRFLRLSVANEAACAIREDGRIACWVLLDPVMAELTRSTAGALAASAPEGSFTDVAVGRAHACALRASGHVVCWGDDARHQGAAPSGRFVALSASQDHTCALAEGGQATCWGDAYGSSPTPAGVPPEGARFSTVSTGGNSTCGATRGDGRVLCWGPPSEVTAGDGPPPGGGFRGVTLDLGPTQNHACAWRSDGSVICWGHLHADMPR